MDASKGGLTLRHGDNVLTFGAYVQVRAIFDERELYDADAKGTLGYGEEDGVLPSFDVTRVRLSMRGTMFRPWVRYMVSLEASRSSGESDSKIKDAYVELGGERAAVRAGQYKVPFGMQTLTPDVSQGFVERSIAAAAFAPDRDTGVIATGFGKARKLGWSLGAFNGSGEGRRQNNESLLWSARAWFDPLGEYKLAEGSVDGPPRSVVHLGLALRGGDMMRGGRTGVVQDADTETAVGLELGWRKQRAWASGEGYWQQSELHNPTSGPDVEALGLIVQGGLLVLPPALELALRFSQVDPSRDTEDDRTSELRAGVCYYLKGHSLKLQGDVGRLTLEPAAGSRGNRLAAATGERLTDWQGRVQLQLSF